MFRTQAALAAALAALASSAAAQVTAQQTVLAEKTEVGPDGEQVTVMAPADKVIPGDKLAYVLTFENEGDAPAEGLAMVMPVPEGVALIAGSASDEAAYSVDGGRTYAALAALRVEEDGTPRPATPADVTHLRWRLAEALAPGETGEVGYRAVLR